MLSCARADCPGGAVGATDAAGGLSSCERAIELTGQRRPGRSTVRRDIDVRAIGVRDSDIDGLRSFSRRTGSRVKNNPREPNNVSVIDIARQNHIRAWIREVRDLAPGGSGIRALPEAISTSGSKVQNAVEIGVDRQSLAHVAGGHVASDLEGHRYLSEGAALI